MTPLRQHMMAALQLSGKGERTQEAYVREVRLLAQFSGTSPNLLSEQELQPSCLHRTNVDGLAPASMRICSSGIRFLSHHVLKRDWHTLALIRAQPTHRLPAVLSLEEVRRLLKATPPLHHQGSFPTVSSLGLRLHEALSLQVSDIDGQRLQVHVHRGKGATARYVPLPEETLIRLRASWKTPRHQPRLFPATGRDHKHSPTATSPMRRASVQGAFRTATSRAGMTKTGVPLPPLSHAYATPLLEAGINSRLIPRSLGHTQLETTMVSLHLTHTGHEDAYERLHSLMQGCLPGPPGAISSPPLPQNTLSTIPIYPSHTARASALSKTAKADTMDRASLSAKAVASTTGSIMPVATGTVPSASIIQPRSGFRVLIR